VSEILDCIEKGPVVRAFAMELIGQFDSPFVRRVAIALAHYEIAFEHRPWSVWAEAEELARINPLRRVPTLVLDDGETLFESSAILDALDDLAPPSLRLLAANGPTRRHTLRVCALATGLADKAVSLLYEGVLRKEGRRSRIWIERCEAQIGDTMDRLESERAAAGDPYWFGSLTHADIALGCALRFVSEAHPALLQKRPRPHLARHAQHCEASAIFRSAVQALHVAVDSGGETSTPRLPFVLRLVPPRATFMQDMAAEERAVMMEHVAYWRKLLEAGTAIAYGPVMDPNGGYGIGIVEVAANDDVKRLEAGDPAILSGRGFRYEVLPMARLVTRP
jgi:glutathione S-transferase